MLHSSSEFDLLPTSLIHVGGTNFRAPLSSLHAMTLNESSSLSSGISSSSSLGSDSSTDSEDGIRVRNRSTAAGHGHGQSSSRSNVQSSNYSTNTNNTFSTTPLPTSSSFSLSSSSSTSMSSSPDDSNHSSDPCDPVTIDFASSPTKQTTPTPPLTHRSTTPLVQLSPSKIKAISSSSASRTGTHAEEQTNSSNNNFQAPLIKSYNSYRADSPPHQHMTPSPPAPTHSRVVARILHWLSVARFYHPATVICAGLYVALIGLAMYVPYALEAESDQLAAGVSAFGSLSFYLAPSPIYSPFLPSHAQNQLRVDMKNYLCSTWMETWWPNQNWKSTLVLHGSKNEVPQFNYYKFQQQQQQQQKEDRTSLSLGSWWPFSFLFVDAAAMEAQAAGTHQQPYSHHHDNSLQQQTQFNHPRHHESNDEHRHQLSQMHNPHLQRSQHLHQMYSPTATGFDSTHSYHPEQFTPPHPSVVPAAAHAQQFHPSSMPNLFPQTIPRELYYQQPYYGGEFGLQGQLQQQLPEQFQPHQHSQFFTQPLQSNEAFIHPPPVHLHDVQHDAQIKEHVVLPGAISTPMSIGAVEQKLKEHIERDIFTSVEKKIAETVVVLLEHEESKPQDASPSPSSLPVADEIKSSNELISDKMKEKLSVDEIANISSVEEKQEHPKLDVVPVAVVDVDAALQSLRQRKPSVDHTKEDQINKPHESFAAPQPVVVPPPPQPSNSMHSPPSHVLSFRFWPLVFYMSCSLGMLSLPYLICVILAFNFAISVLILTRQWWKEQQVPHSPSSDQNRNKASNSQQGFLAFMRSKLPCGRKGTALRGATLHSVAPARSSVPSVVLTSSSKCVWIQALAFCVLCGFPAYLVQRSFVERQKQGKKGL